MSDYSVTEPRLPTAPCIEEQQFAESQYVNIEDCQEYSNSSPGATAAGIRKSLRSSLF